MAHFLDSLPFDLASQPAQELWGLLGDTYYRRAEAEGLIRQAGMRLAMINFNRSMDLVWADILVKGRAQDRLRPLLQVIADGADIAVAARIRELVGPEPPTAPPTNAGAGDLDWKAPIARAGGSSEAGACTTLLNVGSLRRGTELAESVCRMLVTLSDGRRVYGDGLRVADRLILTNYDVLSGGSGHEAAPAAVEAWFGFERNVTGVNQGPRVIEAIPASIRGNPADGWGVIELRAGPPDSAEVVTAIGVAPPRPGDQLHIIQHPHGGPKQIGMVHNEVCYVDDHVVQYRTDTATSSPGAPVFDERWQLVALNDKDETRRGNGVVEHRHQGRRIEPTAEALHALWLVG